MKKRKATKWSSLMGAARSYCSKGTKTSKKKLDKAIEAYTKDALSKGKTKKQINSSVARITNCKTRK